MRTESLHEHACPRIRVSRLLPLLVLLLAAACGSDRSPETGAQGSGQEKVSASSVQSIQSAAEFARIVASSGDRLLMFDLYADWCGPCRALSPVLEEVAREQAGRVSAYKIDVDQHRDLAVTFQVSGIPLVVFMRNQARVAALTGLQPKGAYVRTIERFAPQETTPERDAADGELVAGRRVIRIAAGVSPNRLHVYRGETVALVFEPTGRPFSLHIPALEAAGESAADGSLELGFKAEEIGVFPFFCNGRCPTGDEEESGAIVVLPFEGEGAGRFTELDARQANEWIAREKPLVLDVRTPAEFDAGHLPGAVLIPLSQLDARWEEIAAHREGKVLLTCRSGNRSTVAAEILVRRGFRDLYNLRGGVRAWSAEGLPLSRPPAS